MAKRKPFGVYNLIDSEPDVAVIRYDGDPDIFAALATDWLSRRHAELEDGSYSIAPPQPRLYRFNPSSDPDFAWMLGRPARPGPGVFTGAILTVGRRWSCPCCLVRYDEGHAVDCVKLLFGLAAKAAVR